MQEVASKYLEMMWSFFQYDIEVFSKTWIYAWLCIPAIFYMAFFFLKWAVLTAPIWMPFRMAISGITFFTKPVANTINNAARQKAVQKKQVED